MEKKTMKDVRHEGTTKPSSETPKGGIPETTSGGQTQASMLTGTGNVDKIRDILFGSQMREYEKRFIRLEDRMQKEVNGLKDDLRKGFESLEHYMKKEFELLNERQKKEQDDRSAAVQELSEDLKGTSLSMEKKVSLVEEQLNRNSRELREEMLNQYKTLSDEIRQKHETISGLLEREAHELQVDKVDRNNLSELFMEMAMRLGNKGDVQFDLSANDLLNE
jgi:hypothetical protein